MAILKGTSLFSNVGVAEAYFEEIGIKIEVANEIDEKRAAFYSHLYPETDMICGDITDIEIRNEIVNKSISAHVDFLIATPPCQGMSEAGLRKEFDERNQLIFYAIDTIKRINPKFVLLENVPKQLTTKIEHEGQIMLIPDYIKSELAEEYNFNKETLIKARYQGVPQLRERNIFLLVRKDIKIEWKFPKDIKEITLEDAISGLPSLDPYLREGMELTLEKFPDFEIKRQAGLNGIILQPIHGGKCNGCNIHRLENRQFIMKFIILRKMMVQESRRIIIITDVKNGTWLVVQLHRTMV